MEGKGGREREKHDQLDEKRKNGLKFLTNAFHALLGIKSAQNPPAAMQTMPSRRKQIETGLIVQTDLLAM